MYSNTVIPTLEPVIIVYIFFYKVWSQHEKTVNFIFSGDILSYDEYGYFYFKDRTGDTFRWKGENVSTTEVEGIISKLSGFKDAVVYGVQVPHTDGKAGMVAIADSENNLDLELLIRGMKRELPSYAIPIFLRTIRYINTTGRLSQL